MQRLRDRFEWKHILQEFKVTMKPHKRFLYEPIIFIKSQSINKRCTSEKTYSLFYPIKRILHNHSVWKLKRDMMRMGFKPKQCQGCGEGVSGFKIADPNRYSLGTNKSLTCCEDCVSFYDWFFSREPIKYRKKGTREYFTLREIRTSLKIEMERTRGILRWLKKVL